MAKKLIINDKFILSKYNIDTERKQVPVKSGVSGLDLSGPMTKDDCTIKEYKEWMLNQLNSIDESYLIEVDYYGYDGGLDINIIAINMIPEDDRQVIERLKKVEREKRKI